MPVKETELIVDATRRGTMTPQFQRVPVFTDMLSTEFSTVTAVTNGTITPVSTTTPRPPTASTRPTTGRPNKQVSITTTTPGLAIITPNVAAGIASASTPTPTSRQSNTRYSSPPHMSPGVPPPPKGGPFSPTNHSNTLAQRKQNLENRAMVKQATILPVDRPSTSNPTPDQTPAESDHEYLGPTTATEGGNGRLSESRANLMRLNEEFDAMIGDVRSFQTMFSDRYAFLSDTGEDHFHQALTGVKLDEIPQIDRETGSVLYDTIIAELTLLSIRKVIRMRHGYRGLMQRMHMQHEEDNQRLQRRIQELEALKFEQVVTQLATNGRNVRPVFENLPPEQTPGSFQALIQSPFSPISSPGATRPGTADTAVLSESGNSVENGSIQTEQSTSNVPMLATENSAPLEPTVEPIIHISTGGPDARTAAQREQLEAYIVARLEYERTLAMEKIQQLGASLAVTQSELQDARREVQTLRTKVTTLEAARQQDTHKELEEFKAQMKTFVSLAMK